MMILKYLSLLLVLHVLFHPSTCSTDMKDMSEDEKKAFIKTHSMSADELKDLSLTFQQLLPQIGKCFKDEVLDQQIATDKPDTCPKLENVFTCIYVAAKGLISGDRSAHIKTIGAMRGLYLTQNNNKILADCKIDPAKIVTAGEKKGSAMDEKDADKQSAGTRNHGAGVVGAILMAAAVVIVI